MKLAFICPGQAAQAVGMGKEWLKEFSIVKQIFDEVDAALGEPLTKLMLEGPADMLTQTENACALPISIARVLQEEFGIPVDVAQFVAGHSLGEYSALTIAGAISLADSARFLRTRGQAMQKAVPAGVGAMAALFVSLEEARDIARCAADKTKLVCEVSNDNGSVVVVSGHVEAVAEAMKLSVSRGSRKGTLLPVSAPFHCALMEPVQAMLWRPLAALALREPVVSLVSNASAQPVNDPDQVGWLLLKNITGVVRWRESIHHMVEQGVNCFAEIGHGSVLAGIGKRIAPSATHVSLGAVAEMKKFAKVYSEMQRQ